MEQIKFEQLSERGQFVVKKYKEFIDKNLNKINCNVLYVFSTEKYYDDNNFLDTYISNFTPSELYIGNPKKAKELLLIQKPDTLKQCYNYFNNLSNDLIEIRNGRLIQYIGTLEFNVNFGISYNKEALQAYRFIQQKNYFCPKIKKPFNIGHFAFDESFFL